MKLSTETMKVLENFARINPSILLKPGKNITTINNLGSVLATATIDEYMEYDIPIYDLKSFLSSMSLFKDPEIEVESDLFLTIRETEEGYNSSCNFHFGHKEFIKEPPISEVVLDNRALQFHLDAEKLASVQKAAGVFKLDTVTIFSEDGAIMFGITDPDKPDQNTYSVQVGEWDGAEFKLFMKIDNLVLLAGDYNVTVEMGEQFLGEFANVDGNVTYWVSLDDKSEYAG
jgi:hypothetical protein